VIKPKDFYKYKQGVLHAEGVSVERILKQFGSPVYIYSQSALVKPLQALKRALKPLHATPCFAVKSNSNIAILNLLKSEGAGMDIVSGGELYRCGLVKVPGKDIVFSGVGKTAEEIREGLFYDSNGIFAFNVESIAEISKINDVAKSIGRSAPIALRFNPNVDAKTHPYISTGLKKNKFGISKSNILSHFAWIMELENVELKGISIHIGSQILGLSPLKDAFGSTEKLIIEIEKLAGQKIEFVDLGGGLGIQYKKEKIPDIDAYGKLIKKHFGKGSKIGHALRVIIEPGRVISGNSGILVSKVLFKKQNGTKKFLIIDAGMNDLIRPALYQSYHEIVPVRKAFSNAPFDSYEIVGPVCESSDCFGSTRKFSKKIDSEDSVAILSAGAYGFTMANQYNSRPLPPEVLVSGSNYRLIRERQDYSDLVSGEQI